MLRDNRWSKWEDRVDNLLMVVGVAEALAVLGHSIYLIITS